MLAEAGDAMAALMREGAGERELGEALSALCAVSHAMDLDAETALRSALGRRIERLENENKTSCT